MELPPILSVCGGRHVVRVNATAFVFCQVQHESKYQSPIDQSDTQLTSLVIMVYLLILCNMVLLANSEGSNWLSTQSF